METYVESGRVIPVYGCFDVIVCGGGPTGFMAAVASARAGARTLLIERYGFLGGTATAALMVEFGGAHDGSRIIIDDTTREFLDRMVAYGGADFRNGKDYSMRFDPETMIYVCQEMLLESGATLLLHSSVVSPLQEGNRVTGVIVENKSGRQAIYASVIIDCTGDADVAARAGADTVYGRTGDGRAQPVSLEFLLGNVDTTRVTYSDKDLVPAIREARENGTLTIQSDQFFSWGIIRKRHAPEIPEHGWMFINATNILDVNGINADDLTTAEIELRRQIDPLVTFLRSTAPGFETCYVDRVAAQVGIRETRRIIGDYILTRDDVLSARHFADGIVPASNSIDVHDIDGKLFKHEFLQSGTHYQIPYRCFLPQHIEGLLVAGRTISCDHNALGSVRVMIICLPMGLAVGTAAAIATKHNITPRLINPADLREALKRQGAVLESVATSGKPERAGCSQCCPR